MYANLIKAKLLVILVLAIGLNGCVYAHGNKKISDVDSRSQIKRGVSTKADVLSLMGKPAGTTESENGEETWNYVYSKTEVRFTQFIPYVNMVAGGSDDENHYLTVLFDKNGVVKSISQGTSKGGGGGIQDTFK